MQPRFRQARLEDLPAIVQMLADDFLGSRRERVDDPMPDSYIKAFREIDADPNNELIVVVLDEDIVGTLQLTFTPSISFQGGKRCTVESVRVDKAHRGKGIGHKMMLWAIGQAQEKGCVMIQLGTHRDRTDAHRFYDSLGFSTTHVEMKMMLK